MRSAFRQRSLPPGVSTPDRVEEGTRGGAACSALGLAHVFAAWNASNDNRPISEAFDIPRAPESSSNACRSTVYWIFFQASASSGFGAGNTALTVSPSRKSAIDIENCTSMKVVASTGVADLMASKVGVAMSSVARRRSAFAWFSRSITPRAAAIMWIKT